MFVAQYPGETFFKENRYTEKITLLPQHFFLLMWPQQTRIVVVIISLITVTTLIYVAAIHNYYDNLNCHHNHSGSLSLYQQNVLLRQQSYFLRLRIFIREMIVKRGLQIKGVIRL